MSTASLRREMTVRHTDVMAVTWLHSWCSGRTVHTCAKLLVRHPCVIAAAAHRERCERRHRQHVQPRQRHDGERSYHHNAGLVSCDEHRRLDRRTAAAGVTTVEA